MDWQRLAKAPLSERQWSFPFSFLAPGVIVVISQFEWLITAGYTHGGEVHITNTHLRVRASSRVSRFEDEP